MHRIAFRMSVNKGSEAEYEKRHDPIWEELNETLLEYGVKTYSIFIDDRSGELFAYAEVESLEKWQAVADTGVCRKWWRFMGDIMPANEDCSPVSSELREVFHIENKGLV